MRMTPHKRWFAGCVAVSYLLGYLLVFAHFVGEQHATCVEHGEAHHVEDAGEPLPMPLEAGIAAHEGTEDDHCSLLNAVRDPLNVEHPHIPALTEAVPRIDTIVTQLNLPPPHYRAIWRYAPKQSPPA